MTGALHEAAPAVRDQNRSLKIATWKTGSRAENG